MNVGRRIVMGLLFAAVMFGCARTPPLVEDFPADAERRVQAAGLEIHYFDFHPEATGTPILFLHGYSGSGYEAYFFQDDLADFRIIAPDLPGLGRSAKPDVVYNLSYYLEFVRGFIRTLGLDQVVLAGHSMGGKIAAVYTALHGSSGIVQGRAAETDHRHVGVVEKLILLAPYGLDGEAGDIVGFLSNTGDLVNVSFNLHNQTLVDVAVRLNVFHDNTRIPEDLVDYIASATFYSDNGVRALASITRNAIARDPIDWLLPEIAAPTLLVWGENDRVLSFRHASTYSGLISGSQLVAIPECGHMPHVECQDLTSRAMIDFLSANGKPAAPDTTEGQGL